MPVERTDVIPYDVALELAKKVERELNSYCTRVMICGSIRRFKEFVHDIDIVYVTGNVNRPREIANTLAYVLDGEVVKGGDQMQELRINEIKVELYRATPQGFPSTVFLRTGSENHNIRIAATAKQKGWKWETAKGIVDLKDGKLIAPINWTNAEDGEEQIYRALGLAYLKPEMRE